MADNVPLTDEEARELVAPRRFLDDSYRAGEYPGVGRDQNGLLGAAGRSFNFNALDVANRWRSAIDPTNEQIDAEEAKRMAEGRDIPFKPGMSRVRMNGLISEYDYNTYESNFEFSWMAEAAKFVGGIGPQFLDPVNIATMPIGGAQFKAAYRAATLYDAMRLSAAGAAKVAVASVPLEAVVEQTQRGQINPMDLATTAIAPFVLGMGGVAVGRMVNGRRIEPGQPSPVQAAVNPSGGEFVGPPRPIESPQFSMNRADQMFENQGGLERWFSEFAAGKAEARKHIEDLGFDPDAKSLRSLVEQQSYFTSKRTPPPAAERFRDLTDFVDALEGRATPDQLQRLQSVGMLEQVTAVGRAEETPGFQRDLSQVADVRRGEQARQELAQVSSRPEFAELADALKTPGFQRSMTQKLSVDRFMREGVDGLQARHLDKLEARFSEVTRQLGDTEKALAGQKGRKPKDVLAKVAELRKQAQELSGQIETGRKEVGRVDERVPADEILGALSAARAEAKIPPQSPEPPPSMDNAMASTVVDDPEINELKDMLKKYTTAEETDSAELTVSKLDKAMKNCGVTS